MRVAGREIKVVAGDDGQAWLCLAVSSADLELFTALLSSGADKCRSLKGKVRTAEITRFRGPVGYVP